jgi:hypothetical protein
MTQIEADTSAEMKLLDSSTISLHPRVNHLAPWLLSIDSSMNSMSTVMMSSLDKKCPNSLLISTSQLPPLMMTKLFTIWFKVSLPNMTSTEVDILRREKLLD